MSTESTEVTNEESALEALSDNSNESEENTESSEEKAGQNRQTNDNLVPKNALIAQRKKYQSTRDQYREELSRREKLESELEEYKARVRQYEIGNEPQYDNYDTEEEYYRAKFQWEQSKNEPTAKPQQRAPSNKIMVEDEVEEYLDDSENEIINEIDDYPEKKQEAQVAINEFLNLSAETNSIDAVASLAYEFDINPAKVVLGLSNNKDLIKKFAGHVREFNNTNSLKEKRKIKQILKEAEKKVQIHIETKLESSPESSISSSSANVTQKTIDNLRNKWIETGSEADFQKYRQMKRKVK